jgi:hypothetical protein
MPRIAIFLLMLLTSAWCSFVSWGGLYVFGGRVRSIWEFLFFALPVTALPIALLRVLSARLSALLLWSVFAYAAIFVLAINWPHVFGALGTVIFPMFRVQILLGLIASVFAYLEKKAIPSQLSSLN